MAPAMTFKPATAPIKALAGLRRSAKMPCKMPVSTQSKEMMVWTPNDNKCAFTTFPAAARTDLLHRRMPDTV